MRKNSCPALKRSGQETSEQISEKHGWIKHEKAMPKLRNSFCWIGPDRWTGATQGAKCRRGRGKWSPASSLPLIHKHPQIDYFIIFCVDVQSPRSGPDENL